MKLAHLKVENYRGLKSIDIPLSRFGCLIGRNNAGKSSLLQALSIVLSSPGPRLTKSDYFDPTQPIRIALTLSEITDEDLSRLEEGHRARVTPLIENGSFTLVRIYGTDTKSKWHYVTGIPADPRFSRKDVDELLKGKRKGAALVEAFPELEDKVNDTHGVNDMRDAITSYGRSLPREEQVESDVDLPTGMDSSLVSFLPERIYIPAVKNLSDDVKASQTTPFGRIMAVLLDTLEPKLASFEAMFKELSEQFNRVVKEDGSVEDKRLTEVKLIESTVQKYVRESFSNVSIELKVPPPELKAILSSAELLVDDGVHGPLENKGDGLRRAVVFAIFRSYVELSQPGVLGGIAEAVHKDRYVLLFEEPELYLHPAAQHILFDALKVFSQSNHVFISTHSASFFAPDITESFIKLKKNSDPNAKPFTEASLVDVKDVTHRDRFQLICYENNNVAFFFDGVVLVEGDSDLIVFPHIASLINSNWPAARHSLRFARISGKRNIRRYRDFFQNFGVKVAAITDLDLILNGFDQVDADESTQRCRNKLIQLIDAKLEQGGCESEATRKQIKEAHGTTDLLGHWKRVKADWQGFQKKNDSAEYSAFEKSVDDFFAFEKKHLRLEILRECPTPEILKQKHDLLCQLRKQGIYVLEKGAIEAYYPETIKGSDKEKLQKALSVCNEITTKEAALSMCCDCEDGDGNRRKEFEIIFESILQQNGAAEPPYNAVELEEVAAEL